MCVTNANESLRCCTEDGSRPPEIGLQELHSFFCYSVRLPVPLILAAHDLNSCAQSQCVTPAGLPAGLRFWSDRSDALLMLARSATFGAQGDDERAVLLLVTLRAGLTVLLNLWQLDFGLAGQYGLAKGCEVELGFACFWKHFVFLFPDVMIDLLGKHFHFCIVEFVGGIH